MYFVFRDELVVQSYHSPKAAAEYLAMKKATEKEHKWEMKFISSRRLYDCL